MFDLLHALSCHLELSRWRLLGLLHERMQHHHSASEQCTEEHPGNALLALQSKFEEPVTERLGVWASQIRSDSGDASRENYVSSGERVRQAQDLFLNSLAVVLDDVVHRRNDNKFVIDWQMPAESVADLTFKLRGAPLAARPLERSVRPHYAPFDESHDCTM